MDKNLPPSETYEVTPSRDEIEAFKENGFLAVERLTTDEEINWLRGVFEHVFDPANAAAMGAPVDRSGTLPAGATSKLSQAFFPEMQYPAILQTNFIRNARKYAAALLDVAEQRLSCWGHMIRKPPGGRVVPWHQDHAYWLPELDYYGLAVWLPLHDVSTEMGAMQFVPGSHKRGLISHHHTDTPEANLLEVDESVDPTEAVACPLKMGGATFHHAETFHHTAPNTTDMPRLAFPVEFQVAPIKRDVPREMPWVAEHRAATGPRPLNYVADGKLVTL